jgi:hypothetical protein
MGLSSPINRLVFDEIRQTWVKATPEELVRQRWLKMMVHQLQYPKELLVIEKEIKDLPHLTHQDVPDRRIDILCYAKGSQPHFSIFPLLLVECKDEHLTEGAVDQVIGYNHHIKACFVAVVNLEEVRLGYFNRMKKEYVFCSALPPFKELMQWVKL